MMVESVNTKSKSSCLLVGLRPRLVVAISSNWPIRSFILDQIHYFDAGYGEWTGFYDWLRDAEGRLLGVRYWPHEDTDFFLSQTEKLNYVAEGPAESIEIYFTPSRFVEQKLSADQDLVYDAVFKSDNNELAIAFEIGKLHESDLVSLRTSSADWKPVTSVEH